MLEVCCNSHVGDCAVCTSVCARLHSACSYGMHSVSRGMSCKHGSFATQRPTCTLPHQLSAWREFSRTRQRCVEHVSAPARSRACAMCCQPRFSSGGGVVGMQAVQTSTPLHVLLLAAVEIYPAASHHISCVVDKLQGALCGLIIVLGPHCPAASLLPELGLSQITFFHYAVCTHIHGSNTGPNTGSNTEGLGCKGRANSKPLAPLGPHTTARPPPWAPRTYTLMRGQPLITEGPTQEAPRGHRRGQPPQEDGDLRPAPAAAMQR